MAKFNFSFDVSTLTAYVNELDKNLIQEKILNSNSIAMFNKYPTKTGTNKLNLIDTTIYTQDSACGLSESGTTTFSQQTLTAEDITVVKKYCTKDLFNYWQSQFMSGKFDDLGELESQIIDAELKRIADVNEIGIWQSIDGGAGGVNLNKYDGIIEVVSGQSCVDLPTTASSVTYDEIDTSVQAMTDAIPDAVAEEDDLVLFMNIQNFKKLARKYNDTYKGFEERKWDNGFEMMSPEVPGLKIKGVRGLTGKDYMVLTPLSNVYVAMSEGTEIDIKWEYDNINRNNYLFVDYLMGVQVARPEYVVTNFLTA